VELFTEIEAARERWDVLRHPFYQRWSEGTLERAELAAYSGQYRHAVVALAEASARADLGEHAEEEAAHVALWDDFTAAIGGDAAAAANPETAACARVWAGDGERDLLPSLVALYAIESGQPAIADTKRRGLREFYGCASGPATAYFDLHAELDHEHAADARALIEPRVAAADEDALVAEADAVLRANWDLLDGVDRVTTARRTPSAG
jgi:pyrroloquinoline-quinone synthase